MLKLFFGPHLTETLTAKFDELLSWADILAMEQAYNDDVDLVEKYWNAVSKGVVVPAPTGIFPNELFGDELKRRIMITNIDVVFERSPLNKQDESKIKSLYNESRALWQNGETKAALYKLGEREKEVASQVIRRDLEYSHQLKTLSSNEDKNILCYRGPIHYDTLPVLLVKEDVSFSSYLFREDYSHPFAEAVTSRLIKGGEIDDHILELRHIEEDLIQSKVKFDYETRMIITKKVLEMKEPEIEEYIEARKPKVNNVKTSNRF